MKSAKHSSIALFATLCLLGCHFTEALWKTSIASPSGNWIALAETENTDTIGNVEYTTIRIKKAGSWKSPTSLLVFDGGIDERKDFQMKWDSPSHIDIVTRGYGSTPPPYRSMDSGFPITFTVHYVQKPYQRTSQGS